MLENLSDVVKDIENSVAFGDALKGDLVAWKQCGLPPSEDFLSWAASVSPAKEILNLKQAQVSVALLEKDGGLDGRL